MAIYLGIAVLVFVVGGFGWWIQHAHVFWQAIAIEVAVVAALHLLLLRVIRSRRLAPLP